MRGALALLPVLLLAVSPTAAEPDGGWLPFDYTPGNQVRFAVTVDGVALTALLDTGVSHSAISRDAAAIVGLRRRQGGIADAVGGSIAFDWADPARITFGPVRQRAISLAVVDLPLRASGRIPVDLLIGRDLLADHALDIDYAGRRFRLLPSGRLPYAGTVLPLTIGGARPTYLSEIRVGGRRLTRMAVDTGDGGGITLTRAAWRQVAGKVPAGAIGISHGVGGTSMAIRAILPSLEAGPIVARDVPVAVEGDGGFTTAIGMSGRLGTGFLRAYRVLLDPGAGRMVLAPAARIAAADPPPHSGG